MGNAPSTRDRSELEAVEAQCLGKQAMVVSHQGLRQNQEDAHDYKNLTIAKKTVDFFAVLDGHGGSSTSKHCEKRLLVNLSNSIRFDPACLEVDTSGAVQNMLDKYMKDAFVTTERELLYQNHESPSSLQEHTEEEKEQSSRIFDVIDSPQLASPVPQMVGGASIVQKQPVSPAVTVRSESSLSALAKPFLSSSSLTESEPLPQSESDPRAKPPSLNLMAPLGITSPPRVWSYDDGSGSCALVCMKTPEFIALANAGDCRALLIRKDKSFEILIDEHKAINEEETARIKSAGLYVSEERVIGELIVSRSIGDFKYKGAPKDEESQAVTCVPTTKILRIDDTFAYIVLMSDGIVDGITMDELSSIMSQDSELEEKILEIVKHCLSENHSYDNMTLIGIPF